MVLGVMSPGPSFATVTSTAMSVSRRAALLLGLGLSAATFVWSLLATAGLGTIIAHVYWIYVAVKLAGALYLIWLGVRMLLGARRPMLPASVGHAVGSAAFRKGFLVSITNPKAVAFYGSIFTVLVPPSAPVWFYAAIVLIASGISAAWYCSLALLFSHAVARRLYAGAKIWIEATMGVVLIVLGSNLLLSR